MNFGTMPPLERIDVMQGFVSWLRAHPSAEPNQRLEVRRALWLALRDDERAMEREAEHRFTEARKRWKI